MKPKFTPATYAALKRAGHSNREIAKQLGVDEASVRRALKKTEGTPLAAQAAAPKRRVTIIVIEE